ncbi:hypothetical protein K7432_009526, partial [Basidiobolus ranarum]
MHLSISLALFVVACDGPYLEESYILPRNREVTYKTKTGKKGYGVIAIIVNSLRDKTPEACVLLFKKSKEIITIAGTFPIYDDFELSIKKISQNNSDDEKHRASDKSGHLVNIRSGPKHLMLTIKGTKVVQSIQYEVNTHIASAKKNNWHYHGKSHQWVRLYKVHELDERVAHESRRNSLAGLRLSEDNPFMTMSQLTSNTELEEPPNSDQIKEDYIMKKMQEREKEFTLEDDAKVFVGTWNVNGRPSKESLIPWFKSSRQMVDADIIAIGFQELDLSPEAFLLNDGTKEEEWTYSVEKALALMEDSYIKLKSKQLVGMLLMIYVKKKHVKDIEYVASDSAGCGIMGMM